MIRILHIIDCMEHLGGAQEILVELARLLPPREFQQTILRLHGENNYSERLANVQAHSLSLSDNKYDLFTILRKLAAHLRRNTYDIIHLHLQVSTAIGVPLARLCSSAKVVVTIYASKNQSPAWIFPTFAALVPFVDIFVGLTRHQLSGLTQHALARPFLKRAQTALIPVGLDLDSIDHAQPQQTTIRQELDIPAECPLLLNVARFRYRKGQEYLLRALALVIQKIPDLRCIFVGHGPDLERLQALTRELHLDSTVDFLISRSDLPNFFHAADLFVNASIFEGMGVIVYQAMAYGKAVVGFNAGSADEVVIHGETGLLVQNKSVDALASAIITVLHDQSLRQQYGAAGRKRIEDHFLLADKIQDYVSLYHTLARKASTYSTLHKH